MVLFTATMFASLTMTAALAPSREEQYRAKYGRYTPAYEATVDAKPSKNAVPDCSGPFEASVNGGSNEVVAEARVQAARVELARHSRVCRVLDHCPLPLKTLPAASSHEARSIAKYGR